MHPMLPSQAVSIAVRIDSSTVLDMLYINTLPPSHTSPALSHTHLLLTYADQVMDIRLKEKKCRKMNGARSKTDARYLYPAPPLYYDIDEGRRVYTI